VPVLIALLRLGRLATPAATALVAAELAAAVAVTTAAAPVFITIVHVELPVVR